MPGHRQGPEGGARQDQGWIQLSQSLLLLLLQAHGGEMCRGTSLAAQECMSWVVAEVAVAAPLLQLLPAPLTLQLPLPLLLLQLLPASLSLLPLLLLQLLLPASRVAGPVRAATNPSCPGQWVLQQQFMALSNSR